MLCCLLLGGCADSVGDGAAGYVVRPEDTLYSIAWRHNVDFRDLARWNNIGADFRISVGQVLVLGPSRAPAPAPRAPRPVMQPTARTLRTPPLAPSAAIAPNMRATWVWPTDRSGAPLTPSGGGILLAGVLGQDVRAASGGRVVYIGSGLRGYGNLIIIKHGDTLLSAYAHNSAILVREGQDVAAGQVVAKMGEGPGRAPMLYFEIRQNGKPVNALAFLPVVQ